ncbi:MAG: ATP phosphoribosyltransferase regulatory subunit [Phycisphaerales bacterium]|nr:ATP phosphoribosyltransferase regulatory subunit [Phycisphaerales bacterium]
MASNRTFQAPKGTRDFYPPRMAIRRHIESAWHGASVDSGFEEIEGPMFESLELYTVKSGPEIVSQLFSFRRDGGDDDYAMRPEFTPTLARMAAAKGKSLSIPTKWYAIPAHFRAERPQRGRLREHNQWNVDLIGTTGASADIEVISTALLGLERLGLTPDDVKVRLSHRTSVANILGALGVGEEQLGPAFQLLDRRDKMDDAEFRSRAAELGLDQDGVSRFDAAARSTASMSAPLSDLADGLGVPIAALEDLSMLREGIDAAGLADWCVFDIGIVRGLAYYTGMVFEIFETSGVERAVAGGGRYDRLIELFGGPSLPACGFGMGDVVLELVLAEKGLLGDDDGEAFMPRPDVFAVSTCEEADPFVEGLLVSLRRSGLHARRSYKSTRNVGKLLSDAGKCGSRTALILDQGAAEGVVSLKDLEGGDQVTLPVDELADTIHQLVRKRDQACDS